MTSSSRRILVTGGAGFLGSHLVDKLILADHRVTVLDNLSTGLRENIHKNAAFVEGDVRDQDLVGRLVKDADACFHLAAIVFIQECEASWTNSHSVNTGAFVTLLEQVAKRKDGVIPVVYASSAAVYGDSDRFPLHEDLKRQPLSIYGADKASCELHAYSAGHSKKIPTFGLRPFNIYGPRQRAFSPYSGVISVFADRLKRGEKLTIYGDGTQTRDFIHVEDVITHFIAALNHASVEAPVCNVATGKETSILDIAQRLAAILKCEAQIDFAPKRSGDIYRSVASISHAQALLKCTAQIDIVDGLTFILKT